MILIHKEVQIQKPIYYTSHVLQDVETRYFNFEKLTYGLGFTARKICSYFQAYHIIVMID